METTIDQLIDQYKLYLCVDCGKCVGSCPMTEIFSDYSSTFSPRCVIEKTLLDLDIFRDKAIWYCLTCDECTDKCPQGVKFRDFINHLRSLAIEKGITKLGLFCRRCGEYFIPVHTLEYIKAKLNGQKTDIELLGTCPRCRKYDYGDKIKELLPVRNILNRKNRDTDTQMKKKSTTKRRIKNG